MFFFFKSSNKREYLNNVCRYLLKSIQFFFHVTYTLFIKYSCYQRFRWIKIVFNMFRLFLCRSCELYIWIRCGYFSFMFNFETVKKLDNLLQGSTYVSFIFSGVKIIIFFSYFRFRCKTRRQKRKSYQKYKKKNKYITTAVARVWPVIINEVKTVKCSKSD